MAMKLDHRLYMVLPLVGAVVSFICASACLLDHRWVHYPEWYKVKLTRNQSTWSWWHLERNRGLLYQCLVRQSDVSLVNSIYHEDIRDGQCFAVDLGNLWDSEMVASHADSSYWNLIALRRAQLVLLGVTLALITCAILTYNLSALPVWIDCATNDHSIDLRVKYTVEIAVVNIGMQDTKSSGSCGDSGHSTLEDDDEDLEEDTAPPEPCPPPMESSIKPPKTLSTRIQLLTGLLLLAAALSQLLVLTLFHIILRTELTLSSSASKLLPSVSHLDHSGQLSRTYVTAWFVVLTTGTGGMCLLATFLRDIPDMCKKWARLCCNKATNTRVKHRNSFSSSCAGLTPSRAGSIMS